MKTRKKMSPDDLKRAWFEYANRYIDLAEQMEKETRIDREYLRCRVAFWCWMAIECYLGGYILFKTDKQPEYDTSLVVLCNMCEEIDPGFFFIANTCAIVDPYDESTTYPDGLAVSEEKMREAIECAYRIKNFRLIRETMVAVGLPE
jgi:hypothetical protein